MSVTDKRLAKAEHQLAPNGPGGEVIAEQPLNIIDFATNPKFLGRHLFPAQGTVLKILTLAEELLTDYDYKLIAEWNAGFTLDDDGDSAQWSGEYGIPGDVLDRIAWNRSQDKAWFGEALLLIGRRGSKNYLTGILSAWVLWKLLTTGDPHQRYGIDPDKRLTCMIFAGKKDQAIANQFRDLAAWVQAAPCFKQFCPMATSDSLVLFTAAQVAAGVDTRNRSLALLEIRASETTLQSGRGPASPLVILDEFAFLQGAGATANSVDLYSSATPACAQFGGDAPIVQTTSPWDKQGQAWITYKQALEVTPGSHAPAHPDFFVIQVPSWELYRDCDQAATIPMWPGGSTFPTGRSAVITYDDRLKRKEKANPESFAVEYRAHWRVSLYSYLSKAFVNRVFAAYNGAKLAMQTEGKLNTVYTAHGDPSLSQANFGFCIAHVDYDDDEIPHVVFDVIRHWAPSDFPDGIVNYSQIEQEIFEYVKRFRIETLTFDHWNSAQVIQRLQARIDKAGLPWRTQVSARQPDARFNWDSYEMFKTAIGHNIIHAPEYPLARAELDALIVENNKVAHPTTGDTRTKDVADSMANATYNLIAEGISELFNRLAELPLRASRPAPPIAPGAPAPDPDEAVFKQLREFGRQGSSHGERRGGDYRGPAGGARFHNRRRRY